MGFKRLPGNLANKTNPIPRDRDNSDDIYEDELRVRTQYKKIAAPDAATSRTTSVGTAGTKVKGSTGGASFNPSAPSDIGSTQTFP